MHVTERSEEPKYKFISLLQLTLTESSAAWDLKDVCLSCRCTHTHDTGVVHYYSMGKTKSEGFMNGTPNKIE